MKTFLSTLIIFLSLSFYCTTFTEHQLEALMNQRYVQTPADSNIVHDLTLASPSATSDIMPTSTLPVLEEPAEPAITPIVEPRGHSERLGAHWPPTEHEDDDEGGDEDDEKDNERRLEGRREGTDEHFEFEIGGENSH